MPTRSVRRNALGAEGPEDGMVRGEQGSEWVDSGYAVIPVNSV